MIAFESTESDNEFGYDFSPDEELLLIQLASDSTTQHPRASPFREHDRTVAAIDAIPGRTDTCLDPVPPGNYQGDGTSKLAPTMANAIQTGANRSAQELQYCDLPSPVSIDQDIGYPNLESALSRLRSQQKPLRSTPNHEEAPDHRPPLERFRSFPKRPLTVTDLTSGAWCELQYWYTLTRLPGGRRTRTPAMRQGSKVHQKLEDEVHTTVRIDITSKEDGFGLRLWNFVQGLRTLRETGLTRELEVWGIVDGNLVNGIIDSVSHKNPNSDFEEEIHQHESQRSSQQQSSLTDYFPSTKRHGSHQTTPKAYLADVKTRGSLAPVSAAQLRPAKIQLLLYHRFLSDIAAGRIDFQVVFQRYGLDIDANFSDSFIAQVGALHDEMFTDASSSQEAALNSPSAEPMSSNSKSESYNSWEEMPSETEHDFLKYRNLRELTSLVQREVELTFPLGEDSLGKMLQVQYVHRDDGRTIDLHDFPVAAEALEKYLGQYMAWWRGDRPARGVDIEEAFKCRTCEFVDDCSWRQQMSDNRVKEVYERMAKLQAKS